MRKFIPVVIVGALAMLVYQKHQRNQLAAEEVASEESEYEEEDLQPEAEEPRRSNTESRDAGYTCDGRQHCSEMSSCAEARWFLQHCSGMKMDGDHDGIPCEDQFCGH